MLLDPETLDLAPRAAAALAALGGDPRFKPEMPAAQLEIVLPPAARASAVGEQLAQARRELAGALEGIARPAAAGAHPFASPIGELNPGGRYESIAARYGQVAGRQLVCALHVHVAVGHADRALAVYNALRSYLPHLAALAANAPLHDRGDTGLASVRPTIGGMLPRQGVPPPIASWEAFAEDLVWGARTGAVPEPRRWWWELRPNPAFGTLEVRVADAQTTPADAAALAAVAQSLVAWLAGRVAAGESLATAPSWRIAENRWSACRFGVEGELADLDTGELASTRSRLAALLDELAPVAAELGCLAELAHARTLVVANGAIRQREVAARDGARGLAMWLADRFSGPGPNGSTA